MKYEYRYSVEDCNGEDYDDAYVYSTTRDYDLTDKFEQEWLVEECASDFHSNHDGWDWRSWNNGNSTVAFYLWIDETSKVRYDVQVEYEPRFMAYEYKDKK